jgi:site-specific DNA-methyltransferase (adenine-specific)
MRRGPFSCLNADAREPASYARVLGEERADLLLSDPPYCLLTRRRKGGDVRDPKGRKIEHDRVGRFESVRDYRAFTEKWLGAATPHLTPEALLVVWTNFLGKAPIVEVAEELGFGHLWGEFRWCKKTTEGDGNEVLLRVYEVALVLSRRAPPVLGPADPVPTWAVVAGYDEDGTAERWGSHPNHKPFTVVEPLVRTYSRPGQLVLDPFAGSGSLPEAALRLGRRAATMELDPEWAGRVQRRLEDAQRRMSGNPHAAGLGS